jgi:hypothetical protein
MNEKHISTRLSRQLRKVDRTGWAGRETIETLLVNDLISFGSPRSEINHPYNCYRLTYKGRRVLEPIECNQEGHCPRCRSDVGEACLEQMMPTDFDEVQS